MSTGALGAPPSTVRLEGVEQAVTRIFCIGRNYADHVNELGNRPASEPVVFLKPASCLVRPGAEIPFPSHGRVLHHEAELVLLLGRRGEGWGRVRGVGVGLDLTLRDVQSRLKERGLPWERAKAFEASAPVGDLVGPDALGDDQRVRFECRVNGRLRQRGDSADMLFGIPELLESLGEVWKLGAGDLLFTGTPAGVGPLEPGDEVTVSGAGLGEWSWRIGGRRP